MTFDTISEVSVPQSSAPQSSCKFRSLGDLFGSSKFGSSKFVKVQLLKVRSLRDLFRLLKVHVSLANVDAHAMKALGHTHGTVNATV